MKILVALDGAKRYRATLALLGRLRFASAEVVLLHSELCEKNGSMRVPCHLGEHHHGMGMLLEASVEATAHGLTGETIFARGNANEQVQTVSDEASPDLLALGEEGCLTQILVTQLDVSMLIVKGGANGSGPVRCLFATDQSAASAQALETFLNWRAFGVEEIIIMTALAPTERLLAATSHRTGIADDSHDARTAIRFCERLSEKVREHGLRSSVRLLTGYVPHAIDQVMHESSADVLVLGAHGPNRQQRAGIGGVASVVLAHAVYPVIIISGGQ